MAYSRFNNYSDSDLCRDIAGRIIELENKLGAGRIIRISNEGQLRWEPIAVLSTACSMVLAWFPFDSQRCFIKLASMDHPFFEVNLILKSNAVDTDLHETQADWELVDTLQTFSYLLDDGGVAYPVVEFGIIVKRLPLHYILIVIVPTILTAVLTFIAFFLPLKSGTRLGYIVTVVLALVVLLTLFADTIPSAAKFPSILVAVFTVTLGMAFLLIIITIFVMRIYNKPKRDVAPKWMHSMVRKIRQLKSKLLLKCKCRASRIDHLKQNQPIEDGRPTEETNRVENSTQLKPYSNQELAEFFDNFLFVVFTVLYILILSSAPVVAAIWVENYKSN
ncbi:neuronal acetylcholine receptor subunit alpha-4-like [Mytilus trossulus]|uniref:neuronal acetylcholine receptor subunit alpha-4-like n=1 Tax=Mytilus trossulus TaxID=6551 RepID=UPI0030073C66